MLNLNSNTPGTSNQQQTRPKETNKLKIAHRTRSKYQIELSLAEIESDLPDELFNTYNLPPQPDANTRPFDDYNLSSSNLLDSYSNSASTPGIEDPQDNLWMEFLNRYVNCGLNSKN